MDKRNLLINVPNTLTILRVVLTPVFAICLIRKYVEGALLVFIVAALTDGLDGMVARLFRQKTIVGAFLDPAADKLLLTTAFIILATQNIIPPWLAVIVISRDVVIFFGIALLSIMDKKFEAKPKMASKITTVAQLATVFIVLLGFQWPTVRQFQWPLFWLTAGMTTISGFQYIYFGLNILQGEPNHEDYKAS
jgi:cardiolipin synthase